MARKRPARRTGSTTTYSSNPNFQFSAADMAAMPIFKSPRMMKKLVDHCLDRVKLSNDERNRRAARMQSVDVQISGFIKTKKEDKQRKQDRSSGKAPKPIDMSVPLVASQLDECTTYMMSVYAPEMDFFEAVAAADKQQMAKAAVAELNKHSQKGQYYRHITKACGAMLKYNFGGLTCYWEKQQGTVFKGAAGGGVEKRVDTVWQGNVLKSIDGYNFGYDTTVHPIDLPDEGEYFWEVERVTPFKCKRMAQQGKLYGIGRFKNESVAMNSPHHLEGDLFYKSPPSVRDDQVISGDKPGHWVSILRGGAEIESSAPGIELLRYTSWLCPKDFKLSDSEDDEVWRIVIANGKYLAFAIRLEDTHGKLPIAIGCPIEDDLVNEQRTHAEQLLPLQHFASFLINSHQNATRKAIWGITVYNPQVIPGLDVDEDDMSSAIIPLRTSNTNIDVDKVFRHYNTAPNTDKNVTDIATIVQLMQKILPTDMMQQVADLERATLYQAAATVQAGNRRQLKIARLVSDQCLNPLKFQMMYNLYANLTSIRYVNEQGQETFISTGDLVNAEIEFDIGTGLKGIDRLITIQILRDVLNAVIQSQAGIQEIDFVGLLNYFTSLAGDKTDLRQFRKIPAVPAGTPGGPANPQPSGAQVGQPGQG